MNPSMAQPGYSSFEPLTSRELEILHLKIKGLSNQEIADQLFVALTTVKWYVRQVYNKLGASNRREATARAREMGLLDEGSAQAISPRHNLPAQTTPFIGREQELQHITKLLADPHLRLLTLTGPGGMGKTRLALEAAEQQIANFKDGVYLIPLAPLHSSDSLVMTIIEHINIRAQANGRNLKHFLLDHLRSRSMLLMLDNFEHVLDAAPLVNDLLQAAPGLKVLATSRERLDLSGETLFLLDGMTLPESSTDNLLSSDAVKLFLQTARRISIDFNPAPDQFQHLVRICHLVRGMPLALLLASAWVDTLALDDIANEITHSIDLLQSDMRDMPDRHRSIRAVFDPTWLRLTAAQRTMLRKLAVFRGGFTRQTAQAVAGADLHTLQVLVSKSLLSRAKTGRYDLHELLRQYAMEQLSVMEEVEQTYQAHSAYFAAFMAQRAADLTGAHQLKALDEIEAEYENIRLAWNWAVEHKHMSHVQAMIESLYWLGFTRATAEPFFRPALSALAPLPGEQPTLTWAYLVIRSWHFVQAPQEKVSHALGIAEGYGDISVMSIGWQTLAWLAYDLDHDYPSAITLYEKSLEGYQQQGNRYAEADVLTNLGLCYAQVGDLGIALNYYHQGLTVSRETNNPLRIAASLLLVGEGEFLNGQYAEAQAHYHEAAQIMEAIASVWSMMWNNVQLGLLAFLRGSFAEAQEFIQKNRTFTAQHLASQPEDRSHILTALLACISEDYPRAWQLCQSFDKNESAYGFTSSLINKIALAMAACGLHDHKTAVIHLRAFLTRAGHSPACQTWCLPIGALLAQRDKPEEAVRMLGLAFTHPASATAWMQQWPLLNRLRASLEAQLGSFAFQTLWQEGAGQELHAALAALSNLLDS